MTLDIIRARALSGIPHGFFGSGGAELNCGLGSSADRALVETNRRRAADAIMPGAPLASVHQIHSATAVVVREAVPHGGRPHADALVTDRPGLLLGIVTAD
ncbi:MAG: laccase domain-containing protein, partial [Pseudomonadota bacterium]|nr:laccase domain-containing protein [Pseudomonadota bacterium]